MISALEKFESIVQWYARHRSDGGARLELQSDFGRIDAIHSEIGEALPLDVLEVLHKYDGEAAGSQGSFIGHGVMGLQKIASQIAFSKSLIPTPNPKVEDSEQSNLLIAKLADLYLREIRQYVSEEKLPEDWHRLEFSCGLGTTEGPYLYLTESTSRKDCILPGYTEFGAPKRFDVLAAACDITDTLHSLESKSYNWDEINFVLRCDGSFTAERSLTDYDRDFDISSRPSNAIRLKYFHFRWIPLIEDHGGNYIGIDLDPGEVGRKGQIIVYGRDDTDMFVAANSWLEFLDRILGIINDRPHELLASPHLHDFLKTH